MEWGRILLGLGAALPYIVAFVVVSFVLIVMVASMVAIWHPDARRRSSAYRVLELLVAVVRPRARGAATHQDHDREQST